MARKKPGAPFAIRKTAVLVEEIRLEGGRAGGRPLIRVAAMVAIRNPYASKPLADACTQAIALSKSRGWTWPRPAVVTCTASPTNRKSSRDSRVSTA